jgi:hypothetical protein
MLQGSRSRFHISILDSYKSIRQTLVRCGYAVILVKGLRWQNGVIEGFAPLNSLKGFESPSLPRSTTVP